MSVALPDIVQQIRLNTRDATRGAANVERAVRDMGRNIVRATLQSNVAITTLQSRIDELGDEAARSTRKVEELTREIAKLRAASLGGGGGGGGGGVGGGGGGRRGGGGDIMGELAKSAGFLGTALKLLKIPVIIWGVGQLIVMVGALSAGLVGLIGAWGPVVGIFATIPGLIAPIVQGFGAVALAVGGVGDAMKAYQKQKDAAKDTSWADAQVAAAGQVAVANAEMAKASAEVNKSQSWDSYNAAVKAQAAASERVTTAKHAEAAATRKANAANKEYEDAMAKLDPSVRRFVEKVEEIKPQFEALRRSAQAGLFPGVVDGMEKMRVLFGPIGEIIRITTTAIGNFVRSLADMLASPAWKSDLAIFGVENVSLLERAGGFLLNILDAMRHLGIAALPLTRWIFEITEEFGEWAARWAETGRESGRLEAFFKRTRDVLTQLGKVVGALTAGWVNIYRIGARLGQDMMDSWQIATERFRDWTRTAEGQKKINEYFSSMRPILYELGKLFTALFKGLGTIMMENNSQTASLLQQLRTGLLPALLKLFDVVSKSFGPALLDALTSFIGFVTDLLEKTGGMKVFFDVLSGIFKVLGGIVQTPVIGKLAVAVLALVGAFRALKFATIILGMKGAFGAAVMLRNGLMGVTLATKKANAEMAKNKFFQIGAHIKTFADRWKHMITTMSGGQMLRAGIFGAAAVGLWASFQNNLEQSRQKAQALREELMKDVDLNNYDEVVDATNAMIAKHNEARDLFDEKDTGAWQRVGRGLWENLVPGTKNTMGDAKAITEALGPEIEAQQTRLNAMASVYTEVGSRLGMTADEARVLAGTLKVELKPEIDAVAAGGDDAAKALDTAAQKIEIAYHRARTFSAGAETVVRGLEKMAEGAADASQQLDALDDILSGITDRTFRAEIAQERYDKVMGKSTEVVKDYGQATEDLSAEWAEKQETATASLKSAQANLTEAEADLSKAKTWDEYTAAMERVNSAQADIAKANAELGRIESGRQKALTQTTKKTAGMGEAYGTPTERARELYDITKDQLLLAYEQSKAPDKEGKLKDVLAAYEAMKEPLEANLRTLGLNEEQVAHYMGKLNELPDAVRTALVFIAPTKEEAIELYNGVKKDIEDYLKANPDVAIALATQLGVPKEVLTAAGAVTPTTPPVAQPAPVGGQGLLGVGLGGLNTPLAEQLAVAEKAVVDLEKKRDAYRPGTDMYEKYDDELKAAIGRVETLKRQIAAASPRAQRAGPGGATRALEAGAIRGPMTSSSPILWAEGKGTEAYIPYDPRYRGRAMGLVAQVAKDFGMVTLPDSKRRRSYAAGGMVPHMAIAAMDSTIRRMAAGGITTGSSSAIDRSVSHSYGGIHVQTVDRASGEKLGRDIAWALIGSRGSPVQKVIA